jgi:hexosaminidase
MNIRLTERLWKTPASRFLADQTKRARTFGGTSKLAVLFILLAHVGIAQQVRVVPEPVSLIERGGYYEVPNLMRAVLKSNDENVVKVVNSFKKELQEKYNIIFSNKTSLSGITITIDSSQKREGYSLKITSKEINIAAADAAGLFYAFQTIRQLLPTGTKKQNASLVKIPCVEITDYPRYAYRGMQLDVSRHFFPASYIKKFIDILAAYKINTFHWHLTDSHGWRLEIKQYPRLTAVGAWRADRRGVPMTIAPPTQPGEKAGYGGFYTQKEVKQIIEYAKERFITIIPEIEMPGHCTAALVAYPQYSDLNNPFPLLMPCGYPGDLKHNFCVGYDSTYVFLQNILKEVMDLFPSEYVHIGGDEVRGEPWLSCPRCRKRMEENGFTTAKQLQAYFTKRMDSFIVAHGKRTIGWEEILSDNISPTATGMVWHQQEGAIDHVRKGYDVVMMPYHYTYFDFYQSDPGLEKHITYAPLYLDTVYAFEPTPKGISEEENKHILGVQACMWTENIETTDRVEYMLLPRLLALAEVGWSPAKNKNYPAFVKKVEHEFKKFDAAGIQYARSMYNVSILPSYDSANKSVVVTLADQTQLYPIFYTLDGSVPTPASKRYIRPFQIKTKAVVKTATFDGSKRLGKINTDTFFIHSLVAADLAGAGNMPLRKLNDGIYGTVEPYDGRWMSFTDSAVEIIADMHAQKSVHSLTLRCMEDQVGNVFLPKAVEIYSSNDGRSFRKVKTLHNAKIPESLLRHVKVMKANLPNERCRFIKVVAKNAGLAAEPAKSIMLLDEITVE